MKYLTTSFIIDTLTFFPIDYIFYCLKLNNNYIKYAGILRLLKIIRVHNLLNFIEKNYEKKVTFFIKFSTLFKIAFLNFIKMSLYYIILNHLIGC